MAGIKAPTPPGVLRLYFLCFYFGIGASVWGYNIGILSSVLVSPGWTEALNFPTIAQKGNITGVYYVGTLISYALISHPASDWLGRRYAALSGTIIVCLGAILQGTSSGATAYGTMITGRLISGLGVAIVSTSVPLYQAEISPANKRGHFVTMNHVGFIAGMATGLWVGFLMRFWDSSSGIYYGWRVSILLEIIPALIFGGGLHWIPETPRWLVENGNKDRARSTLQWLREGSFSDEEVEHEFSAMVKNVDMYHRSGSNWLSLFKEKALFSRLWRAALLQFMAQLCGATSMKYYLPSLLKALGLGTRVALMAGAVEMTIKIGFTILEMFIIDRFGRRNCLIAGCAVMALSLLINGALPIAYPNNISKAADAICIIFIFVYAMGFSLGFGPAAWVYNTEIFPTSVRARGLNFAAAGGSIASVIVAQVWPMGMFYLGSNVYFIFMAVNIICIPVIFAFYPETKGRELEDMDALFGAINKRRTDRDDLSEHLLQDDAHYRDSEESVPETRREEDRDLSLIQ